MLPLEALRPNAVVSGLEPGQVVRVVTTEAVGPDAVTVYYKTPAGQLRERMLFRSDEPHLTLAVAGRPWAFDAPGEAFKLAAEAYRIDLAYLFDPMMAVHTANVEPLPHQITAVYASLLPRQPLRYLLADDPGAGKTIMAGLYIRELDLRADARRVLIVAPGSLVEQWQDELGEKFGLAFTLFSRELVEQTRSGNPFDEHDHLIARVDQLARAEDLRDLLATTRWDLVVVDEAHKLSANYYGTKLNKTKRFLLGELLGAITRHFLLMTATPHNGKEEDFQVFLSLLDADRFYGKFRDGAHKVDVSDLMRRMVKEEMLRFDGSKLFPPRRAYTVNYRLSDREAALYAAVTDYVKTEFAKADALADGKRKGTVGFALTTLQRRLASSPEAIYQSLRRRRHKLQRRVEEERLQQRGHALAETLNGIPGLPGDLWEAADALTAAEYEDLEETLVDQATAAQTIQELEAEIHLLTALEEQARQLVHAGQDRKWDELSRLLQDTPEMRDASGRQRQLILFTEHRDTLNYLAVRIRGLLGSEAAVVLIHGGIKREERRKVQELFRNDPEVRLLLATDAAGEGVNLQNANLMVNYDLPWNPNRLEQRFGRIHRIGQTEVCHLWNLVAAETREGDVFQRLFAVKAEMERAEARKLQPYFIRAFFTQAFQRWGGELRPREAGRFEIPHVPASLRERDRLISGRDPRYPAPVLRRYARVCFDKQYLRLPDRVGAERAEVLHPGHPLMQALTDLVLEAHRPSLKQGAVLVDPADPGLTPRLLFLIDHAVQEGADPSRVASRRLHFVTLRPLTADQGNGELSAADAGWAPHLDLEPLDPADRPLIEDLLAAPWLTQGLEPRALAHAGAHLVPDHFTEVRTRRERAVDKTLAAVHERLVKEINFWSDRYIKLQDDLAAGKDVRLTLENVRRTLDDLTARRESREKALLASRHLVSATPVILGGALVIPAGLLRQRQGQAPAPDPWSADPQARARIERIAMGAVLAAETALGHAVSDVSAHNCGWDVTSQPPAQDGRLPPARHIEVKGRAKGQDTIAVTRNEILAGFNQGDKFLLAIVLVDGDRHEGPFYVRQPFAQEPDWAVTSVNFALDHLLARAREPEASR